MKDPVAGSPAAKKTGLRSRGLDRQAMGRWRAELAAMPRALAEGAQAKLARLLAVAHGAPRAALNEALAKHGQQFARLIVGGDQLTAIRPPTAPLGSARLRVALGGAHEAEDLDRLFAAMGAQRQLFEEP